MTEVTSNEIGTESVNTEGAFVNNTDPGTAVAGEAQGETKPRKLLKYVIFLMVSGNVFVY